jgi:hypothetical protein
MRSIASASRWLIPVAMAGLSACGWLHLGHRHPSPPDPTQLVVTGAPKGSIVFIDGAAAAAPTTRSDEPQLLGVAPGTHQVEIHLNDVVVYREDTYVGTGDRRVVTVLSGTARP